MDQILSADSPAALDEAAERPIHLLTFSTLYPHDGRPNHGIFVETRLRHLVETGEATSVVLAPVPWFPSSSARFGDWARNAQAKRHESRHGLSVFHPRYALPPKIGMSIAPASLLAAALLEVRRISASGTKVDLIDGHYLYPDGVVAVALGRLIDRPVVLTARGSDITQLPDYAGPRRMVQWAMRHASALISVSRGLQSAMVKLGAPESKVTVLRNGVDLDLFRPGDRHAVREKFAVKGTLLLSVGHLIERKRHDLALRAVAEIPGCTLAIVGEGPEKDSLERLALSLGIADRVRLCGPQPHAALPGFYSAADLLILASSREGWANVLLEAMACGTPVVASNIPGNAEVVADSAAGEVVEQNTPTHFAQSIQRVLGSKRSRAETRAYAENFSWDATSQGQLRVFRQVLRAAT